MIDGTTNLTDNERQISAEEITYWYQSDIYLDVFWRILLELEQISAKKMG